MPESRGGTIETRRQVDTMAVRERDDQLSRLRSQQLYNWGAVTVFGALPLQAALAGPAEFWSVGATKICFPSPTA